MTCICIKKPVEKRIFVFILNDFFDDFDAISEKEVLWNGMGRGVYVCCQVVLAKKKIKINTNIYTIAGLRYKSLQNISFKYRKLNLCGVKH